MITSPSDNQVFNEENIVIEYLKNTTNVNQAVDGSVTPVEFSYTPPEGKNLNVARIMLYMEDSTAFTAAKFAGIAALTNGWEIKLNDTVIVNAKDNAEFAIIMYDAGGAPFLGKETQTLLGRLTLAKLTGGEPITIPDGSSISTVVNDDLTGIDRLNVVVEGYLENAY